MSHHHHRAHAERGPSSSAIVAAASCLALVTLPRPAHAGFFDSLTGSTIYRACTSGDATPEGCSCAEAVINETISARYMPIVEALVKGDFAEWNRLRDQLATLEEIEFGAQRTALGTVGVSRCDGARKFLLYIALA